jgi:hypothetical protein
MTDSLKIVCLLDVLGFEGILEDIGLSELEQKYDDLISYVQQQTGGVDIQPTPDGHVAVGWLELGNAYASDSVLFWTDYSQMSLPSFTDLVSEAVCRSIEIGLPLRGTVSVGEAILDKTTGRFLGWPLIEAARTEKMQKWVGVSFGKSFAAAPRNEGFHLRTVLPFKSHYAEVSPDASKKRELCTGMVVDWPRRWRETRSIEPARAVLALDRNPKFSSYYQTTVRFTEFSRSNHDWFTTGKHLEYG